MAYEVFVNEQIAEEQRGLSTTIITHDRMGDYDTFLYRPDSKEFIQLTGVRTQHHLVVRIYLGISHNQAVEIAHRSQELNQKNDAPPHLKRQE